MSNFVNFTGNLLHDLELSNKTAGGQARLNLRIAVDRFTKEGEEKQSDKLNITAFGSVAENLAASAKKGDRLTITGRANTYPKTVTIDGEEKEITMTSFVATEASVNLRFATAEVTRNPKGSSSSSSSSSSTVKKSAPAKAAASSSAGDDDF